MALLFLDGFEEWDASGNGNFVNDITTTQSHNGVQYGWNSIYNYGYPLTNQVRTAQNGISGKSLYLNYAVVSVTVPTITTLFVGVGIFIPNNPGATVPIMGFCKNSIYWGNQSSDGMRVAFNANGTLSILNGSNGSVLATSTLSITAGTWNYIEIRYVFGTVATGSCQLKVDGVDFINAVSIDTTGGASSVNAFYMQGNYSPVNNAMYYDDLYICDSSGTTNNTFLGPIGVYTLIPASNTATVDMAPSAGSNYACVKEIPWNTTDYVTASASNQTDLYGFTTLPGGVTATSIPGVLVKARAMKPTANSGQIQLAASYSGSTAFSASKSITQTSYLGNWAIFETQPSGSAWTQTAVNAMAAGFKIL